MKKIFTLVFVLSAFSFYGQSNKITFLDLVGNHIQVPKGCEAKSEYELQACNGTSIKWCFVLRCNLLPVQ